MKKFLFLSLLVTGSLFVSCSDDDDDVFLLPHAVEEAFSQKYPGQMNSHWETEDGKFKAEFRNEQGLETEAWFSLNGTWERSETEVLPASLPAPVKEYVATNHPGYMIDEAEFIELPTASYYKLELEAKGMPDVDVNVYANGLPYEGLVDGDILPTSVPAVVKDAFAAKYPGMVVVEWSVENGYYQADFFDAQRREMEANFTPQGHWAFTSYDYVGVLPQAVQAYLNANYATYQVDDVDYIETAKGNFFYIELEQKGSADLHLQIREDGTLW